MEYCIKCKMQDTRPEMIFTREEMVAIVKAYLPNFERIETRKS